MPPTATAARIRDHIRLACLPGVGSRTRRDLLAHFGSPEAVMAASPRELAAVPGVLEVSIGHALIAEALVDGLAETVRRYRAITGG